VVKANYPLNRTGIIIQARLTSKRLPHKVLFPLPYGSCFSVLGQVIERAKNVKSDNKIIVVTTQQREDDEVERISKKYNIDCFRGEKDDVLSRFYSVAKKFKLDTIVRLTADNPCYDCSIIDSVLELYRRENSNYIVTSGYPLGMNVEVFSFGVLEKTFAKASKLYDKEHVTSFMKSNPDLFKILIEKSNPKPFMKDIRLTLDVEEDYVLLCVVYDELYKKNKYFGIEEITQLFEKKPWLKLINKNVVQKKFNTYREELGEAIKILDLQDLKVARDCLKKYIGK
jgi:spore coat polysaccharide biosynthesis protein SpsF